MAEHKKQGIADIPFPLLLAVVAAMGIAAGYMLAGYMQQPEQPYEGLPVDEADETEVDLQNLKDRVSGYLTSLIEANGGVGVEVEATDASKENGMYVVGFDIRENDEVVQQGQAFVSLDGTSLFLSSPLDLTIDISTPEEPEVPKSDKPVVEMFVMSFCPYGQQAESGLAPVAALLGDKIDFQPHYVVYGSEYYQGYEDVYCMPGTSLCSMHGVAEINEDARQACIMRYEPENWWDYTLYVNSHCSYDPNADSYVESCWLDAAAATGVDADAVQTCFEEEGVELMQAEKDLNAQRGVSGSPMLFINGQLYNGGRSAEDYKGAICAAFNDAPEECEQELSSTGSTASGSC